MMCGGTSSPTEDVTDEVKDICNMVRADLETKSSRIFEAYEVILMSSQVVAGINYFVKINVGSDNYVHARIFKPLPHTGNDPELHSYQLDKSADDELSYF